MKIFSGVDIISNKRIERAYSKFGERFLKRIYHPSEVYYCKSKVEFINCLSARFAGKEAFIKAFYKAFGEVLSFRDIEIVGKSGRPAEIILHHRKEVLNNCQIDISLSHERGFSLAYALIILM